MTRARARHLFAAAKRRLRGAPGVVDLFVGPAPPGVGNDEPELSILFVCHGNICRSPMAEDILRRELAKRGLLGRVSVASAGIECAKPGRRPDLRARACARRRGGNLADLRSRRLSRDDLQRFDVLVVMDSDNRSHAMSLAQNGRDMAKIRSIASYTGGQEVGDPVHGGAADFDQAFDTIRDGCLRILSDISVDPVSKRLHLPQRP